LRRDTNTRAAAWLARAAAVDETGPAADATAAELSAATPPAASTAAAAAPKTAFAAGTVAGAAPFAAAAAVSAASAAAARARALGTLSVKQQLAHARSQARALGAQAGVPHELPRERHPRAAHLPHALPLKLLLLLLLLRRQAVAAARRRRWQRRQRLVDGLS